MRSFFFVSEKTSYQGNTKKRCWNKSMNLQQIKYVVTIADSGSFSKASRILYITQPTLSNEVKKVESEMNINIFERKKSGVQLTEDGREFLEYARGVLEQFHCLEDRFVKGKQTGLSFSVASQHVACAAEAFMDLLEAYHEEKYRLKLLEGKTKEVLKLVHDGACQIGILVRNRENRVLEMEMQKKDLEYTPLLSVEPHVYLHKNHPLANRDSLSQEDLNSYPFMVYEQGDGNLLNFSEEIDVEFDRPKTIVVTDRGMQISLSKYMHAYTIGSGILGMRTSIDDMISIPYQGKGNCGMEIGWIKRNDQKMTPMIEQFLQLTDKYIKKTGKRYI